MKMLIALLTLLIMADGEEVGRLSNVQALCWSKADEDSWLAVAPGKEIFADGFESGSVAIWKSGKSLCR